MDRTGAIVLTSPARGHPGSRERRSSKGKESQTGVLPHERYDILNNSSTSLTTSSEAPVRLIDLHQNRSDLGTGG